MFNPLRPLSPRSRRVRLALGTALLSTALSGCWLDAPAPAPGSDTGASASSTSTGISGIAYLGPIVGGTAKLYEVNADGSNGTLLEQVQTTANGYAFTKTPTGVGRICVSGGTYTDEATGATGVANTNTICAIFQGAPDKVYVTPMSTFVDQVTKGVLKNHPGDLNGAVTQAAKLIRNIFNLVNDVHTIQPASGPDAATTNPDAFRVAVLLGGYSQLVKNYIVKCGASVDVLNALIKDITDSTFDGQNTSGVDGEASITCNGQVTSLPTGAGTAELSTAITQYGTTANGQALGLGTSGSSPQQDVVSGVVAGVITGPAAPASVKTLPSQGLIAIDTKNNLGFVPLDSLDASGNAQVAVVDLTPGVSSPVKQVVALTGAKLAVASNFNADDGRVYVLAGDGQSGASLYVIQPSGNGQYGVGTSVALTGLRYYNQWGGVIVDPLRKRVIVAGSYDVGLVDISGGTPVWDQASITNVSGTDSLSFNPTTGLLFVSSDGTMTTVDMTQAKLVAVHYDDYLGTTDGVAFDNITGMMIISPEFEYHSFAINMTEYDGQGHKAPTFQIDGFTPPKDAQGSPLTQEGEGPGQVALNVLTHQALIVDEGGENFSLVQLPTTSITGAATATNAYLIGATTLPKVSYVDNGQTFSNRTLYAHGDPNSVTIDPVRNYGYLIAGDQGAGEFLVRIDLSKAVQGQTWTPTIDTIRLPSDDKGFYD